MIPGIVNAGGEVVALGRRYWSPELYSKRGWEVELHFDQHDEVYPSVYSKGRLHRLCTAALIADIGFADFDAAKAAAKKAMERRASVVRCEADAIVDEPKRASNSVALVFLALRDLFRHRVLKQPIEPEAQIAFRLGRRLLNAIYKGQQQNAQLRDVVLVHAEAIFVHAQAILDAHNQPNSPSCRYADAVKSAANSIIVHRLSETSK